MTDKNQRNACEKHWAKNKYLVLSKSHKIYLDIREYLKNDQVSLAELKRLIKNAKDLEESPKDIVNAYQHIWGYFKDDASLDEKEKFLYLIDQYQKDIIVKEEVLDYLKVFLEKYPCDYLQKSTIFNQEP